MENTSVNINGLFTMLEGWNESVSVIVVAQFLRIVDVCWPDITQNLHVLLEAPDILSTELCHSIHYLISKCYFHIQDYYNSLMHALQSGPHFNLNEDSLYVRAMINTCIDQYRESRKAQIDDSDIPEGIRQIMNFLFSQSLTTHNFAQLIGISVECNRLDLLMRALRCSPDLSASLYRLLTLLQDFAYEEDVRVKLLDVACELFRELDDFYGVFRCMLLRYDLQGLAALLLQTESEAPEVMLQIAFDVAALGDQGLVAAVLPLLGEKKEKENSHELLRRVLRGEVTRQLGQEFVSRRSHHDSRVLDRYVSHVSYEDTNVQSAMLVANGLSSIGSGNEFILNNGSWVKKAENWTKFSIISSFAMKHVYQPEKALESVQNFVGSEKEEEQAGGLFGYSMCMMSMDEDADKDQISRMRRIIRENSGKEMLIHASAISLGLIYCGSYDQGLTDELYTLIDDRPYVGMAAGIAIGLINCGRDDSVERLEEDLRERLLPTIRETQHDRVAAGLAIGVSLMFYDTHTHGQAILQDMLSDNKEYVRMAAVLGLGLAYAGQHQRHSVITQLLRVVASDVSDTVRRNAVFALGYMFANKPSAFIPTASLLLQSCSPHIRYAAALVSGLINAGTAAPELSEPLLKLMDDEEDFVSQGAAIGLGGLFMECNEECSIKSTQYREKIIKTLKNEGYAGARRSDTVLRRQGALLGAGLLDSGGRNLIIQLHSPLSYIKREAMVCFALSCQMWEWFPLFNLIAKSLTPSALLAVDSTLRLPRDFSLHCSASPSLFEYVQPLPNDEESMDSKKSDVHFSFLQTRSAKAILSKTLRRNSLHSKSIESSDVTPSDSKKSETREKVEEEVKMHDVSNGSRVTPLQQAFMTMNEQRFKPVVTINTRSDMGDVVGVMVVCDSTPTQPCKYVELKGDDEKVICPEPFIYHVPEEVSE